MNFNANEIPSFRAVICQNIKKSQNKKCFTIGNNKLGL